MTPNEWRINEITQIVGDVMALDRVTDVDAWFALGKISSVLTTSDDQAEMIIAAKDRLLSDLDQL